MQIPTCVLNLCLLLDFAAGTVSGVLLLLFPVSIWRTIEGNFPSQHHHHRGNNGSDNHRGHTVSFGSNDESFSHAEAELTLASQVVASIILIPSFFTLLLLLLRVTGIFEEGSYPTNDDDNCNGTIAGDACKNGVRKLEKQKRDFYLFICLTPFVMHSMAANRKIKR